MIIQECKRDPPPGLGLLGQTADNQTTDKPENQQSNEPTGQQNKKPTKQQTNTTTSKDSVDYGKKWPIAWLQE